MNFAQLPEKVEALKAIIVEQNAALAEREAVITGHLAHIAQLQEQVRLLQALRFLAASEKARPSQGEAQYSLFDEAEVAAPPAEAPSEADTAVVVASYTRAKKGRKPIAEDFPRVEIVHDIPEADKICPCGCELTRIGEETSEKLDIVPAKIQVLRHIRPKYACRGCEGVEDDGPTVKIAPMPPQLITQGVVTPSLLAYTLTNKFVDSLPFYRQERMFERMGLDISRATLSGWALRAAKACEPLIELLYQEVRAGPIINLDETTVQVMKEPGRKDTSKSYMWVARGGPVKHPVVLFQYDPGRGGKVAEEIVGNFKGFLQTDGYAGYTALGEREGIVHVGCLAHVRRKFVEVNKGCGKKRTEGWAQTVLDLVSKVYHLEKQARAAEFGDEQILTMRQEQIRPILDKIKTVLVDRHPTTPPKSLLGRAISYALGQWPRIEAYLQDANLRPDNNLAENAIRPFAVGRKNWLFSGSPRGAKASAALYSLIETAKANGLNPAEYLLHIFERLPYATCETDYRALLPRGMSKNEVASPQA